MSNVNSRIKKYVQSLQKRIAKLEKALKPFSQSDLYEILGGNFDGDESIVFQRNKAKLTIGDFKRSALLLKNDKTLIDQ